MNRREVNEILRPFNFESTLLHRKDSGDLSVKAVPEKDRGSYFCEGDHEQWDRNGEVPGLVGCVEFADWSLWYAANTAEWFCTSCLLERIQSGELTVVSGAVTLEFNN